MLYAWNARRAAAAVAAGRGRTCLRGQSAAGCHAWLSLPACCVGARRGHHAACAALDESENKKPPLKSRPTKFSALACASSTLTHYLFQFISVVIDMRMVDKGIVDLRF